MYVILFIIVMVVGLLLLFLPFNIHKKRIGNSVLPVAIRVTGIILCIVSVLSIYAVLSGKIVLPLIKEKSETAKSSEFDGAIGQTDVSEAKNAIIPLKSDNTITDFDSSYEHYEYYLTKEELIANIEQGYIFRLDTSLKKPYAPYVTQGNWSFYVHEKNTVNLEVGFSNLLMKPKENIFPLGEQVIVELISPDEEIVYHFEKIGDEITKDTSIQKPNRKGYKLVKRRTIVKK